MSSWKYAIIGSENGLSAVWRQTIIWTNVAWSLFESLGTNFSVILIDIHIFHSRNPFENIVTRKMFPPFDDVIMLSILLVTDWAISTENFWLDTALPFEEVLSYVIIST